MRKNYFDRFSTSLKIYDNMFINRDFCPCILFNTRFNELQHEGLDSCQVVVDK